MSINSIQVRKRTASYNGKIDANGSYTLPQHGFIPPPGSRPIASGSVPVGYGHQMNPGFIAAANADTSQLPATAFGRAVGVRVNTANIQVNPPYNGTEILYQDK